MSAGRGRSATRHVSCVAPRVTRDTWISPPDASAARSCQRRATTLPPLHLTRAHHARVMHAYTHTRAQPCPPARARAGAFLCRCVPRHSRLALPLTASIAPPSTASAAGDGCQAAAPTECPRESVTLASVVDVNALWLTLSPASLAQRRPTFLARRRPHRWTEHPRSRYSTPLPLAPRAIV